MTLTLHGQRLGLTGFFVCFLVLQLRQRERWFIVHKLHLATSENRTNPWCWGSRVKGQQDCSGCKEGRESQVVSGSRWWYPRPTETYCRQKHTVQCLSRCPSLQHVLLLHPQPLGLTGCCTWTSAPLPSFSSAFAFASPSALLSWSRSFRENGKSQKELFYFVKCILYVYGLRMCMHMHLCAAL